jgi:hypothetical protein
VNERTYLVEVLLRAREQISQVAQRAAKALDNVTASQDKMSESSKRAAQAASEQRGALQQLYESRLREKKGLDDSAVAYRNQERGLRQNAAALREQARQTRASADELRQLRTESNKAAEGYVREAQSLLDLAQARQDDVGKIDKTVESLRKQAAGARRMADENRRVTRSFDQQISAIDRNSASFERSARATKRSARTAERDALARERSSTTVARSISTLVRQIAGLDERTNSSTQSATRFGRSLERLGFSGGSAAKGLRGLNAEFQGLALALAVKYAQSLITALAGLAAQFVAVAAAAGQAAAGIAGALAAGAAQAVPVVGVLAASFARLAAVLKVVKLQNQEQLRASQEAQTAARAQRTANEQIASAEQRVADAHRNTTRAVEQLSQARNDAAREQARAQAEVARAQVDADRNASRAQQDVTQARKDAIRTVQDLIDAERQSVLSVENAQSALRRAIREGDVAGAAQAQLDVGTAQRGATRARQDAAPVRARGVEGVQGVIDSEQRLADVRLQGTQQVVDAEQRLADVRRTNDRQLASSVQSVADAQRQEVGAARDLSRTRRDAKENLDQETSSVNKLHDALMQLSPAERQLYDRVLALQGVYKRVARPITDILTGAFTDVVDATISKLQDPRIIAGFHNIAVQIAAAIRAGTREASGRQSTSAFEIFSAEAARNIPIVTGIVLRFFRTARALALDALPAFRRLLGYVSDYARQLEEFVTANPQGLRDFFDTGVQYAKKFFDLGLAVVRLFLALGGPGGAAAEGAKTVDYLRERVEVLTQKVKDNAGAIRRFFDRSREVIRPILEVIGTLGAAIIDVFDPGSVQALADFINHVIIPAFATAIEILGEIVKVFHQLFTIPGFEQFALLAATTLAVAKSLTVVRLAILEILTIIPDFLAAMGLLVTAEEAVEAGLIGVGESLGFFTAMTPAGWIVLAILAVIAAIALLDKHFHFLGPTFKWLKGAASDTFNWLVQAGKDVVSWFSDVWNHGLLRWMLFPMFAVIKWLTTSGVGKQIVKSFGFVLDFFRVQWAVIKALVIAPFEIAKGYLSAIWGAIKTIVIVALDIISGRFDRIGKSVTDIWEGVWRNTLSAAEGALNTLIDMVNTAVDAINKIIDGVNRFSPIDIGHIGHVGHVGDDVQKDLNKVGAASDNAAKKQGKFATATENASDRANKAMDSTAKTAKVDFGKVDDATGVGEEAFKNLADAGGGSLRDIREITHNTMQDIAGRLGKDSREGKEALAKNFRNAAQAVQDQMDASGKVTRAGMRAIRFYLAQELEAYGLSISDARNIIKGGNRGRQYGDPDNNRGREGGASDVITRAGGGMVSSYGGWPRDDHAVMDPYGRVSAYVSGNEGIVNPPQMARINQWGSIVKGLGLDSYGSLDELWGLRGGGVIGGHSSKRKRMLRTGGQIVPVPGFPGERANRSILGDIAWVERRWPRLVLTDAFGPGHKSPGHTVTGTAADFSGPDRDMDAAVRALVMRHFLVGYDGRFGSQRWPGHGPSYVTPNFHFHVEFGGHKALSGNTIIPSAAVAAARIPRARIRGGGDVGRAVQRVLTLARVAAQRLLDSGAAGSLAQPVAGGGGGTAINVTKAGLQSINHVFPMHHTGTPGAQLSPATVRRIASSVGFPPVAGEQIAHGESNYMPGIVEWPPERDGAQGIGLLQMTTGHVDPPVEALIKRLGGWAQMRNPIKNFIAGEKLRQIGGLGRWHGSRYLTAAHRAGGRLRLQGGGLLARAAVTPPRPLARAAGRLPGGGAVAPIVATINGFFANVAKELRGVAQHARKTNDLAKLIRTTFGALTEDGGVLDQLHEAISGIATAGATALQRAQFRVGRGGPRRVFMSDAQVAQANLGTLQVTGATLAGERGTIQGGIAVAQADLNRAVKTKNKNAEKLARAALNNLRQRLEQNAADMAQNAQDQVEAQESFQQALLQEVNDNADRANAYLDRFQRTARALGHSLDPNYVLGAQINNMRNQTRGLARALAEATRTGNRTMADQVREQIAELNTQIAEAVAQQFQNSIDAVNNTAQSQTTRLDRAARRAQVGGTDYLALGNTLVARQNVLAGQRSGLAALLGQAAIAGNIEQVVNLTDQIDELDTTMAENTQAIKDNTDSAFNARTDEVNNRFGFAQNVLTGAQGFFQAITDATGVDTTPQQRSALQTLATSLVTQRQGLAGQLASLIGDNTATGLGGQDLVNYLLSIATGPRLQAIMSTLDPTQQQSFQNLVTALLGNVTATQENTKALTGLGGNNAQSFSSSFWTGFRVALFNGAGALLPQYATTIPGAAVGARVLNSGALMVHAGETVRPAVINRSWQENAGDTYHLNVTTPTQVLDPTDVGRQLAFRVKHGRR